jgi:hypothetical protein
MSSSLLILILAGSSIFLVKIVYVLSVIITLPFSQGALYVSTTRKRISAFLTSVPMTNGQLLVDLGCGDGRVLRMANKKFGIKGIGYELNPLAFIKAKVLCIFFNNIHIRYANFYKADLSKADIVFCYLFPDVMKKVSIKLKSELKKGAYIVSCNFKLPGFHPILVLRPNGSLHNDPIYCYQNKDECIRM